MASKIFAVVGILLIVFVCVVMPFVSAEENGVDECTSSDFDLKIGEYTFSFEFSKTNEQPSLQYLICKYKEVLDNA